MADGSQSCIDEAVAQLNFRIEIHHEHFPVCFSTGTQRGRHGEEILPGERSPLLHLPRRRLCHNSELPQICHPEHSEGSRIFSDLRRTNFPASPRNDSCDTVSRGGEKRGDLRCFVNNISSRAECRRQFVRMQKLPEASYCGADHIAKQEPAASN
jgi:hypothetical protein